MSETLPRYDLWLTRGPVETPVTCADEGAWGVALVEGLATVELSASDVLRALAEPDAEEALAWLWVALTDGGMLRFTAHCPRAGALLTDEELATDGDRCGTCGGPTRPLTREDRP